jgi:hypothetical protein
MRYANNGGTLRRIFLLAGLIFGLATLGSAFASVAKADTIGPINFESPYTLGNINGQQGWTKTGPYDVEVASLATFPAASGYGFGLQALRLSNASTTGSFGDQTFSPASLPAGESALSHFDASFSIGTALTTEQVGLYTSVSPDNGLGARMSYLRFEDHTDGVHVFFDDVTDTAPVGTVANFREVEIAILSRTSAHTIRFSIDFKAGTANDVVKIYVDGALKTTGTTWEDYYRFDPESSGDGVTVPVTQKLLFREGGDPNPLLPNLGNGFLVDGVSLSSFSPPTSKDQCKNGGWQTFSPMFKNQGECVSYVVLNGG